MNKIIVHPGASHLDDFASCAILIAHDAIYNNIEATSAAEDWSIERRTPTPEELDQPYKSMFVVDIGGVYDPARRIYDHHQLPRGSRDCAMTLLASSLVMPGHTPLAPYEPAEPGKDLSFPAGSFAEVLAELFPWFRVRAELDSCGPFAAAKTRGVDWNAVVGFLGPFEGLVLKVFETDPMRAVLPLAEAIVSKVRAFKAVKAAVRTTRPWWGDGDFVIVDFTAADPKEVEETSDALTPDNGVAVFHDNRGDGLTLLRLGDDPRVDFTRVKDNPEVAFCHTGGFVIKTKSKDLEKAWSLIEGAYQGK